MKPPQWIQLAVLCAGFTLGLSLPAQEDPGQRPGPAFFERLDADGNGRIAADEWERFFQTLDGDKDGHLSREEFRRFRGGEPGQRRPFERRRAASAGADPQVVRAAEALREAQRSDGLPGPGLPAPDFRLKLLDGSKSPDFAKPDEEGRVKLSAHRGKAPVVLIFGSYT